MKRYGWHPDLPDQRDYLFVRPARGAALPPQTDLRPNCPPIFDQGDLGSCTGNAIAGLLGYRAIVAGKPLAYSRLFIYYEERVIEHTVKQDAGAMIRDGMKACAKVGACLETLMPYDVAKFARAPSQAAVADAAQRRIAAYHRVDSVDAMRAALANGNPVVFGFTVYESFESKAVAKSGVVPMPGKKESVLGGHAVLAVGYDDHSQRALVRNSWGQGWGLGGSGYFTMPYAYLADRSLSDDFWTIA